MKRILSFSIILIFFSSFKSLSQIQVIQVKRNIPLSDEEPVFKDYYLSGGSKDGLRVNLVVPVTRWVNLRESAQAQDQSMKMLEPVGWLKVILAQDHLAVARLYEAPNYLNTPILDQPGILMGDVVSLERSFMSKGNTKLPKDSSQVIEKISSVSSSPLLSPAPSLSTSSNSVQNTNPSLDRTSVSTIPPAPLNQAPSLNAANNSTSEVGAKERGVAQNTGVATPNSNSPEARVGENTNGSAGVGLAPASATLNGVNKLTDVEVLRTPVGEASNKLLGEDPQLLKQ